MIKKELTYPDVFTGEMITNTFYFSLNAPETFRIMGRSGTQEWEDYVKEIAASGDADRIMDFIESFVKTAVGERINDRFVKTPEYRDWFLGSEAYGQLFIQFLNDEKFAAEFFNNIISEASFKPNEEGSNQLKVLATGGNRQQRRSNNKKNNRN